MIQDIPDFLTSFCLNTWQLHSCLLSCHSSAWTHVVAKCRDLCFEVESRGNVGYAAPAAAQPAAAQYAAPAASGAQAQQQAYAAYYQQQGQAAQPAAAQQYAYPPPQ